MDSEGFFNSIDMSKLGYTFYPKDWQTSDEVFELNLEQRAVYRELIDLAMINDNKIEFKYSIWSRKLGVESIKLKEIIISLIQVGLVVEKEDNLLFIPSCEKRLNLSRGGKKGGKKSSKNKPTPKPTPKPIPKPIPKQRERERERETKEGEENVVDVYENFKNELAKEGISMWVEGIYMQFKLKPKNLGFLIEDFIKHLRCSPENPPPNLNEFKRHFYNWCNRVLPEGKLDKYLKNPPKQPGAL